MGGRGRGDRLNTNQLFSYSSTQHIFLPHFHDKLLCSGRHIKHATQVQCQDRKSDFVWLKEYESIHKAHITNTV